MEISNRQNIITAWFAWHFLQMPAFLLSVWKNYLAFCADFFSIPLLLSTLFSPWRKYRWSYPKSLDIGAYVSNFIFNTFSRVMGFFCRIALIILGIVFQILVVIAGIIIMACWILLPFISLTLLLAFIYV